MSANIVRSAAEWQWVIVRGANDEKRDPVYQTLVPKDNAKSSYRKGARSTSLHTKDPR